MEDQIKKHHSLIINCSPYRLAQLVTIFTATALLSGCAGMWVDSMYRSAATDDTYSEMKDTMLPPKEGTGRLYIYRTASSTKTSYGPGNIGGSSKNRAWCDLDGEEFVLLWETFFYIDIPEGQHKLSCPSNDIRKRFSKLPVNEITFSITNSADTFVKLSATEVSKRLFKPIIVDASIGQKEIMDLPFLKKNHRHQHN